MKVQDALAERLAKAAVAPARLISQAIPRSRRGYGPLIQTIPTRLHKLPQAADRLGVFSRISVAGPIE
jgi:hypothetical protein